MLLKVKQSYVYYYENGGYALKNLLIVSSIYSGLQSPVSSLQSLVPGFQAIFRRSSIFSILKNRLNCSAAGGIVKCIQIVH